jgi:N-acetyl-alpha-D-muramate 1-phosphate uridylyltransferase
LNALPLLGPAPFLLLSGDVWSDFDLRTLAPLEPDTLGRLVMVANPAHHPRGDFGLEGERLVARERDRLTYANDALLRPELFAGATPGRFPLAPLFERAIAAGRLRGQLHCGGWVNVGTPAQLAELDQHLRSHA